MNVAQLIQQIDLLDERLENLQTGVLPDIKTFSRDYLTCEEEIVKRVLVYKAPEITTVQASLMVGDCAEGFTPPNIYEFAGLTGSIPQLREKLNDELEQVWGTASNLVRSLKEEAKQIKKRFVQAFRGLFREVKKLIGDIADAFVMIGSSIAAITMIIVAPPWNIAEAIVHVIQIIKSLKTIILAFAKLLVHLSPLALLVFVVKKEKIGSIISAIGGVIQIILKLLNPIEIIKSFIFRILNFLKNRKPSCSRQRRRLQKRIRKLVRKKRRFEVRTYRNDKRDYPDWKDRFFDPDTDHITLGGDLNYSIAEKIVRNDVDLPDNDKYDKFGDYLDAFDDANEEIKLLEEQLANLCCRKGTENSVDNTPTSASAGLASADEDRLGSSFTSGPTSISDTSSSDFYTTLGNLADGCDEDLTDNLINKILSDDLSDIGEDTQSVLNDFLTYAVKYPDGTIERGVTEEELDELKNLFTVEIRNSFENL
jgi:hypothetical protein